VRAAGFTTVVVGPAARPDIPGDGFSVRANL
jgi:hypothetical protein